MRSKYGPGTTWYISRMGSSRVPSITRATSTCRDCQFVKSRTTSIFVYVRPPSATGFCPFLPRLFHGNVDSEAWRRNSRNILARRPPRILRESWSRTVHDHPCYESRLVPPLHPLLPFVNIRPAFDQPILAGISLPPSIQIDFSESCKTNEI